MNNYINKEILKNENIRSNWEYRTFLQQNSPAIMKYNSYETVSSTGVSPYYHYPTISSNQPSDLKQIYLNKINYQSRLISPSINVNKLLGIYSPH
jgi:hypothetical protein